LKALANFQLQNSDFGNAGEQDHLEGISAESVGYIPTLTLKALANFSPGLRFGNPGKRNITDFCPNSEGVATVRGT